MNKKMFKKLSLFCALSFTTLSLFSCNNNALVINERYSIAINNKDGGTFNAQVDDTSITLAVIVNSGYTLESVTVNGVAVDISSKEIKIDFLSGSILEIVINFSKKTDSNPDGGDTTNNPLMNNKFIKPTRGSSAGTVDAYYASCKGLKGLALKEELHKIISKMSWISYSSLYSAYKYTDAWVDESTGKVDNSAIMTIYDNKKIDYSYFMSVVAGGKTFNREHVWCNSYGGIGEEYAGADLANLRPAASAGNSERGNTSYGEKSSGLYEPNDSYKGDVARTYFYMATCYEKKGSITYDLELGKRYDGGPSTDTTLYNDFSGGASGIGGNFTYLYNWATSGIDPVSNWEMNRNNETDIRYQHNRNPFIDHPEFIEMIYSKKYNGPGALM